jgi:D-sedoheptulose 7-phosphate isomerase
MHLDIIKNNFAEARHLLTQFIEKEENWEYFEKAGNILVEAIQSGNKILSCGNGGSMSDAMHFAEELSGRFRGDRPAIAATAIADPTHITCTANDYGFDHIFSRYIEAHGKPGDVLLAISTSGNSANVVNAAITAKSKEMKVLSLTGKTGGNLAGISDVELRTPPSAYADRVQEIHIQIIHSLIHYIELNLGYTG